jgi:flavin reductase (DIM6/NTAB) family NADH-FMN oxidoreductase RutF
MTINPNASATSLSQRIRLNPSTLLSPVPPVLVSCRGLPDGERSKANLITVAWAGTINSEPPMVSIAVRKSRYSHAQISETGEFVINLVDESLLHSTDFCGVRSGAELDKFSACHLNPIETEGLSHAPTVAESPLSLACRVSQTIELPSHDLFLATIVSVSVRADLMDKQNRLRLDRAKLVGYVHGEYLALGERLGFFGYSVARPEVLKRRMPKPRARHRKTGQQ